MLLILAFAVGIYANVAYPKPPGALVNVAAALTLAGLLPLGVYQQHYLRGCVHERRVWVQGAGVRFLESLPNEDPS